MARSSFLPYGRHVIDDDDVAAVVAALRSDWLAGGGPRVAQFEAAIAARVGAPFAVAVSSATAGLHLAAIAAGLGPGDEVITTPLTFAASANCILYAGATPVFADVRADSLNLDPAQVERRLTPRTAAIIAVDYAGLPADLDELRAIAARASARRADGRRVLLIEDAAHALGARYRDRPVGSIADLTVFSFHPVKHIATGEGGLVTTDDPRLAARLRRLRNHGISTDARDRQAAAQWYYEMVELGFNYRLTDIQAALGLSQLGKLDRFLARRDAIARRYEARLSGHRALRLPARLPDRTHAWHLYPIRLRAHASIGDAAPATARQQTESDVAALRDRVYAAMHAQRIGVQVHYIPVYLHPYYRWRFGDQQGSCPVAEAAYQGLLSLPIFPAMSDSDVDDVVSALEQALSQALEPATGRGTLARADAPAIGSGQPVPATVPAPAGRR
jgi:perosamine synthetase